LESRTSLTCSKYEEFEQKGILGQPSSVCGSITNNYYNVKYLTKHLKNFSFSLVTDRVYKRLFYKIKVILRYSGINDKEYYIWKIKMQSMQKLKY